MNIRNIKLELTVTLMNNLSSKNYLGEVKQLMQSFQAQVGAFRREETLNDTDLDKEHSLRTLALEYDNCVVCLLYTSPSPRDATLSRMPSSA